MVVLDARGGGEVARRFDAALGLESAAEVAPLNCDGSRVGEVLRSAACMRKTSLLTVFRSRVKLYDRNIYKIII